MPISGLPETFLNDLQKECQKTAGKSGAHLVSEAYFQKSIQLAEILQYQKIKDQCMPTDQDTLTTHMKLKAQYQAEDKQESINKLS